MATDSVLITQCNSTDLPKRETEEEQLRLAIAKTCNNHDDNFISIGFDKILMATVRRNACLMGVNYEALRIKDKLLLTKFRCPLCGVLPLYFLDLRHINRIRCGRCSFLVTLRDSGKYGKIRKKISIGVCTEIEEMLKARDHHIWHKPQIPRKISTQDL